MSRYTAGLDRRTLLITTAGAMLAAPLPADAQQAGKVPRIGYLGLAPASATASRLAALRQGLRDLGYVEGKNIVIDFRWANSVDQLPAYAAEFVRMNVDIIFGQSSTFVEAARRATHTIPILFCVHADPVGTGHVASLSHPGGNMTGLSMILSDIAPKQLEILTQAVPQARHIAVLWDRSTPSHELVVKAVESAGEKLGLNRWTFLGTVGAAMLAAEAQQGPRNPPRIGWLPSSVAHANNIEAFRGGMRALGYPEINLVVRAAAGQMDRLQALAAELLQRNVEVIATDGGQAAFAAKHATATISLSCSSHACRVVPILLLPDARVPRHRIHGGEERRGRTTLRPSPYGDWARARAVRSVVATTCSHASGARCAWRPGRSRRAVASTARALPSRRARTLR